MFNIYNNRGPYSLKELQALKQYIREYIGPVSDVLPSFADRKLSVSVAVIPPAPQREYYTLLTIGMGVHRMKTPKGIPNRLELAIRLPAQWDLDSIRESCFWPIRWLQILARMPLNQRTWFRHGHTVDACRHLVGDSGFHGFALHCFREDMPLLTLSKHKELGILTLIPVYFEELALAKLASTEELFDRLGEAVVYGPVNLSRKNICD